MKNLWRAFKLVLPHRGMLALYALTALGLAVFGAAPIALIKAFLYRIEHQNTPVPEGDVLGVHIDAFLTNAFGSGEKYLAGLCLLLLVLFVFNNLFEFLNGYIGSWLAQRIRVEAMMRVMNKLLSLDQPYFDRQKTGDLVARMVSDGDSLRKTVKIFLDFLQQPFMVLTLSATAIYYDWFLFCVAAVGVPIVIIPLHRVVRNIARHHKRYQEKTADLAQAMLQNLSGIRVIHAYDAADKETKNFERLGESLFRSGIRRNFSRALQGPITQVTLSIGLIAVLYVGGMRYVESAALDASNFVAFVAALGLLYGPVRAMMSTTGELAEFLPSAERTFEILDVQPTIVDPPNAVPCPALRREIVFENISFDYGRGKVLDSLNLTICAGEKLGIVGRTGVGKSTLLSLLLRFYDPNAGRILIDGVDIRTLSLASLRSQMALVNQNPFLFHASVMDNIRYGRPSASDDEVIAAAKSAMIHDEIMQQPENYQTLCGERGGELFSGGQRQRIAVARAILRNAPILLLDEATSALDAFSERRVQEALDALVTSRTSLIVAHRLSTLRNVNRILVFGESGGVEAIAPHEELLEKSPTYRRLWNEQNGAVSAAGS
ncbi:MAG TPA: ABC transporter ATP-binding protein [Planctomycetota bacterium]|nr:ABC transporter ATP-binding protein [Planctomycetota bacterium]